MQAKWRFIEPPRRASRRLAACFTNIYQYDDSGQRIPLHDLEAAEKAHALHIGNHFSFADLKELLTRIVGEREGLFVYSGTTSRILEGHTLDGAYLKGRRAAEYSTSVYTASCAPDLEMLQGFPPEDTPVDNFYLGWLPASEAEIIELLLQRWERWLSLEAQPFLPDGPSPSAQAVEITFFGEENTLMGLYLPESFPHPPNPEWLYGVFGQEVLVKRLIRGDLWHWAFTGSIADLR
ncbi:MAG: hypothetical protein N2045_09735 [Fimbriimonadales bacterium]|nr:hypothetical protein [Fimbriimonadales bacterium]